MKKLSYLITIFLFSFQANAGFLCDMLTMDVIQTQEYEQALDGLKEFQTVLDQVEAVRAHLANGDSIKDSHPGLDELHDMVKQALAEEEKAQGRNANLTIGLDAAALTFAVFLWRSYKSKPQMLASVLKDTVEKKFNPKTWLIPGLLVTAVLGTSYMRYLMAQKKQRITTLREHLQLLAQAQVKQEYLTYLEDIIEDNYSTLRLEKARLVANKCLSHFEFEDGQNYCEEHPEIRSSQNYDKCF